MAACKAGDALESLQRLEEQRELLEKFALRGDSCSAIERVLWKDSRAADMKWLEMGVENDVQECLNIENGKYQGRTVSQEIIEFCSRHL